MLISMPQLISFSFGALQDMCFPPMAVWFMDDGSGCPVIAKCCFGRKTRAYDHG